MSPATLTGMAVDAPARRTQERSRLTRQRLLDAAVSSLLEHGWAGTTTTAVALRAGVSRGAQQNHFPTRDELVVAAVEHLGRARVEEARRIAADLPTGRQRTLAVLEALADVYTGPLFTVALELWVAARTDPALHAIVAPLETEFGRAAHQLTVDALGADESRPGVREAVQGTLDLVRGLALANVLTDDSRRRTAVLRRWAVLLDEVLSR